MPKIKIINSSTCSLEKRLSILAAILTLAASVMVALDLGQALIDNYVAGNTWSVIKHSIFALISIFLVYGGLVYLLTRWGYYHRLSRHQRKNHSDLLPHFSGDSPTLNILIPSYKEEDKVVFQTLLSAALQQYRNKRVVLLIDDPAFPKNPADINSLAIARSLPERVSETLNPMLKLTKKEKTKFISHSLTSEINLDAEFSNLSDLYKTVIVWFEDFAAHYQIHDHADRAFVNSVILGQAKLLETRLQELTTRWNTHTTSQNASLLEAEYSRLVSIFDVKISSFERKYFENLSHEPNKAMNLNSYIGLMGKAFNIVTEDNKQYLKDSCNQDSDISIPSSDFIITLDADSIIAPDYALRLIDIMQQPQNQKLAVVQTPYSSFPGAEKTLERIAGATTDIQYIIHQGFTQFNGTYWVGANALIRRKALDDIAVVEEERGYPVTRYIQDRTVIEDTESSVDLVERGWQLYNYPERLAYSATPPDFGSLIIQRRRWANGGLIILPKLLRYLSRGPLSIAKFAEAFVRIHYLTSIAAVNIGLVIALAIPLATDITTVWMPFTALGYFLLYGRDLTLIGYRFRDLFAVYALNLLLIPINLAGVFKSLQQAWTKEKIPFGRTPKIDGRTASSPIFIALLYGFTVNWLVASSISFHADYVLHGIFALTNACIMLYAIGALIGFHESWQDLSIGTENLRKQTGVKLYRHWRRVNRQTVNVLGNTPIVCLVVKPKKSARLVNNAERTKEVA